MVPRVFWKKPAEQGWAAGIHYSFTALTAGMLSEEFVSEGKHRKLKVDRKNANCIGHVPSSQAKNCEIWWDHIIGIQTLNE